MSITEKQKILFEIEESYWQVISLANKKRLLEAYENLLNQVINNVDALIKNGLATKADGLNARLKLSEIKLKQSKVSNGLHLSKMLLAERCGFPIDENYQLDKENSNLENYQEVQDSIFENNINTKEAIENRSEIKTLHHLVNIQSYKHQSSLAEALPSLALIASYTVTNPNLNHGFKNEFHGVYSIGIGMQVPITGIFRSNYKRKMSYAELLSSKLKLADAQEKIQLEIKQAQYKLKEAYKQKEEALANRNIAKENLHYAEVGFKEGVIPLLQLSEAQTAWLTAQDAMIDALISIKLAEAKLKKTLLNE